MVLTPPPALSPFPSGCLLFPSSLLPAPSFPLSVWLRRGAGSSVSTQVGVGSSEVLVINTTFVPEFCGAVRSQQGDLLEVKYTVSPHPHQYGRRGGEIGSLAVADRGWVALLAVV